MKKLSQKVKDTPKKFKILFGIAILLLFLVGAGIACMFLIPSEQILDEARTYDYSGDTITEDIHITVDGVKLKNVVIEGDLYIDDTVGDGHVELENVEAKGMTYVYGGGKDTVMVIGGVIHDLLGEFNGRLMAINWATMERVVVKSSDVIIKSDENSRYKRVEVDVPRYGDEDEPVEIDANIDVLADNGEADLNLKEGAQIEEYISSCIGEGCIASERVSRVNMEKGSNIKKATVNEPTTWDGEGSIDEMEVNSKDVEVDVEVGGTTSEEGYEIVTIDPLFVSDPIRKMTSSVGDYELTFETNTGGTVYYILQPPTTFSIETPTVEMIKNGEGNSICPSGTFCPPEDSNVVSHRAVVIEEGNIPVKVTGFYGDAFGSEARPDESEMDFEFDPSSTMFAVFVSKMGVESEILRVEY